MSSADDRKGILTFVIADIRGYTSFTQGRGDEAAAQLAGKFAEVTREGIEAHGGDLTELRGDEALSVFSSPRAALRAAVDLQTVYADEGVIDPDLPLRVGIGIDAGEAVPVAGGYRGGALNLAARLCSRAAAGEVLVSQGVAHLAGAVEGILLEPHGQADVKGLDEPVRVFRAVAERAVLAAPRERRADLPPELDAVTPIIGRELELRRIRWMWRMGRRGVGGIAAVLGPPGIGKTRLAAGVAATVAESGAPTRYTTFADVRATVDHGFTGVGARGLTVLDDLDWATDDDRETVARWLAGGDGAAGFVVLAFDDQRASQELLTLTHRLVAGDAIIRLPPLGLEQMLQVASIYVGAVAGSVPRDLLTSTGGIPRKVHEEISRWAHAQASRRLGALADQAAAGRSDLRSVEADLAGTVIDLQLVQEQTRLFGLGPGRHASEPAQPPYRGLSSFDIGDAEFFFGRERLVAELISRLAGAPLLGVIGPSGSGKSSAMSAGLVPALAAGVLPGSERWTVVWLRPGEHPVRALDRALWTALPRPVLERLGGSDTPLVAVAGVLDSDDRVVVIVDQFEEAFTVCDDEQERAAFLDTLVDAATNSGGRLIVVPAVRADFYGRCAEHTGLSGLLAANHVLIGSMTAEEYRRAIVQPALKVGVQVEPELVDDLVTEVVGQPGALPLLSTTLLELWAQRDGRTMRRLAYLASGGVHGAVARLADEVYDGFDQAQQAVARSILLRLAGPGEGEAVVRARVPLSEFDAPRNETVATVLAVLTDKRLVTVSDGAVEVAHEALLREWPRLRGWLEDDREGRRLHAHLTATAREWAQRDRDPTELYRGPRLSAALDWTTEHNLELNELERDFVTISRAESQRDLARRQRQNRRLRALLAGVAVLLVLAVAAGGVALVQRRSAQDQARVALARQLGAEAVTTSRIDEAMLLARQAVLLDNSSATAGTLLATLLRDPAVISTFALPITARPQRIALRPDGRQLAVSDNNNDVRFFDTTSHRESRSPLIDHGHLGLGGGPLYAGADFIAANLPSGNSPPSLDVFDAQTLHLVRTLQLSPDFLNLPTGQFNPMFASVDGRTLYFAWTLVNRDQSNGAAFLDSWDIASGAHRLMPLGGNGMNGASALSQNRVLVVTDTAVMTLDGDTLQQVRSVPIHIGSAAVTPSLDGTALAVVTIHHGAPANTFSLLDLTSGRSTPAAGSHAAGLLTLSFTPDGRSIITTGDDGKVIVWNMATLSPVATFSGHSARVLDQALSADGRTLYTASLDGVIFGWDLGGAVRFGRPFTFSGSPQADTGFLKPPLVVSPDSAQFAVRIAPGQVGIFSVRTAQQDQVVSTRPGADVTALAWSKNQQIAVGGGQGVELWDARGAPRLVRTFAGVQGSAQAIAFTPDGDTVAAVTAVPPPPDSQKGPDGWLGVWDVRSGSLRASQHIGTDGWSVAFGPGARLLAVGTEDGRALVVDAATGQTQRTLHPMGSAVPVPSVTFRADGVLVTGSWVGIVEHWNVQTGDQLGRAVHVASAPVSSLAFAPAEERFATTGGSTGETRIWDDSSLQQFGATFPGGAGMWGNAVYTPDGSNLVVAYGDGSGAIWPVSMSAWLDHACVVAQRNFTREEWARFVPDHEYTQTCPAFPAD